MSVLTVRNCHSAVALQNNQQFPKDEWTSGFVKLIRFLVACEINFQSPSRPIVGPDSECSSRRRRVTNSQHCKKGYFPLTRWFLLQNDLKANDYQPSTHIPLTMAAPAPVAHVHSCLHCSSWKRCCGVAVRFRSNANVRVLVRDRVLVLVFGTY
jgi:hypothetical protein